MKYLHTMVRVRDLDETLRFYCDGLGLRETRRKEVPKGRFTLVFLAAPDSPEAELELTWNWDPEEDMGSARNFGHLAFRVDDIYGLCEHLQSMGYTINRPPRTATWRSCAPGPDLRGTASERGRPAPKEPWASMENTGTW